MRLVGVRDVALELGADRAGGRGVGFVPTMGFLHEGHLALIRRARRENDRVVVSVFVNRLQFGASEDFEHYPRDLARDAELAAGEGADYLFAPSAEEMYPRGELATRVEVGRIGEVVEGRFRPGHFSGVATVCVKLFNIVRPRRAYFGQKDAQQLAVIRQVVDDLGVPVEIVACPTVREADGLAMSSRNHYLDGPSRRAAAALPRALFAAREQALAGERAAKALRECVRRCLAEEPGLRLQYVEVVDPDSFEPIHTIGGRATIALAALVETTRLIDNVDIDVGTGPPA